MPYAESALVVASVLFLLGAMGVVLRRNLLFVLMYVVPPTTGGDT